MNIKDKQTFLKNQGFYTGNIDGVFGKLSKEATKKFQKSQHIIADGIFGKNTETKAKYLMSGAWLHGVVKFTYTRSNGEVQVMYVNENILLSKNFRLKEFMMNANTIKKKGLKVDRNEIKLDEQIVYACQCIRDYFNKPMTIESGYRNATYNKAIGGASKSQHINGKASDINVSGVKPSVVQDYVRKNYKTLGIHGMESKTKPNCNQYTHIDTRNISGLLEF